MKYFELNNDYEIRKIIASLRLQIPNLTRIILPSQYESTLGEKKILTIFDRFDPVLKIEGKEELLNSFRERLIIEQEEFQYRSVT